MEFPKEDNEILTQQLTTPPAIPVKEPKQATLKRKSNHKLGFSVKEKKSKQKNMQPSTSRQEVVTIVNSADEELEQVWKEVKKMELIGLYRNTMTTSTLSTPVHIQTQLVAVPGSGEVQSGDEIDLDDEFSCLNSRFQTGKTSLDILLQKDTQPRTLKAEVMMEDYVYELKIYKKAKGGHQEPGKITPGLQKGQ